MGEKFSNRPEIPLMCRMINFESDRFLDNNIHLTYEAQQQRITAIRKIYKMYFFVEIILKYRKNSIFIFKLDSPYPFPAISNRF